MAQRRILEYPDPRLRERSTPVEAFDDTLGSLIGDLIDTMRATDGIGISAPQIGVRQRVLVIMGADESPEVYVGCNQMPQPPVAEKRFEWLPRLLWSFLLGGGVAAAFALTMWKWRPTLPRLRSARLPA